MPRWQSQLEPPTPHTAAKYWQNVNDVVYKSNFSNPTVQVRQGFSPATPPAWQPPMTSRTSADASLKGT